MIRIFANSLSAHSLYTRDFSLIFAMWVFFLCLNSVMWDFNER